MSNIPALAPDPSPFLATAIDAVGAPASMQLARSAAVSPCGKKGAIDLVTEVDLAIERSFASCIAERFPDHDVLGEEFGAAGRRAADGTACWIFDPIDGTTNFAHGLPIFCASLALEIDGVRDGRRRLRPDAGRTVHGRARGRCVAERRAPPRVHERPPRRRAARHRAFRTRCTRRPRRSLGLFGALHRRVARGAPPRVGGARRVLRGRRAHGRVLGAAASGRGTSPRRRCSWRKRAAACPISTAARSCSGPAAWSPRNGRVHDEMLATIARVHGRACSKADDLTPACDTSR